MIASNRGLHVSYALSSLVADKITGAFEIDRNTGSLVVARQLDREIQQEYRLEIRALDTTTSNNPQSSAVTVKIEIIDVNDNAPKWPVDPIEISVNENSPIGSILYNFTASDSDAGVNGDIHYKLQKQTPADRNTFSVDPLTGHLTQLLPLDFEELNEYLLVVQATDQSVNVTERLSTSVTARILINDINDNAPVFISPSIDNSIVTLSEVTAVGQIVSHVIAIDKDSGENGRITYSTVNGNEDGRFSIDPQKGYIELIKPFYMNGSNAFDNGYEAVNGGKYTLTIAATDHGSPVPQLTRCTVQFIIQGSTNNPPRFVESMYHVNIPENQAIGTFVIRVSAKSYQSGSGEYIFKIDFYISISEFSLVSIRKRDYFFFLVYFKRNSNLTSILMSISQMNIHPSFAIFFFAFYCK